MYNITQLITYITIYPKYFYRTGPRTQVINGISYKIRYVTGNLPSTAAGDWPTLFIALATF